MIQTYEIKTIETFFMISMKLDVKYLTKDSNEDFVTTFPLKF